MELFLESLTHLPLDKMADISQTIFSDALSWMEFFVFWLKFHWSLFLRVQLKTNQHWFRWWLGAEQVTSHYLNQCWCDSLTHICGTRGRWGINSLRCVRRFNVDELPKCKYLININVARKERSQKVKFNKNVRNPLGVNTPRLKCHVNSLNGQIFTETNINAIKYRYVCSKGTSV